MFYLVSIFLLALFDIVATHYQIMEYGSYAIEANPVMRWVMETYGMTTAYGFRLISATLGVLLLLLLQQYRSYAIWLLRFVLVAYTAVVCWHIYITDFFTIHLG